MDQTLNRIQMMTGATLALVVVLVLKALYDVFWSNEKSGFLPGSSLGHESQRSDGYYVANQVMGSNKPAVAAESMTERPAFWGPTDYNSVYDHYMFASKQDVGSAGPGDWLADTSRPDVDFGVQQNSLVPPAPSAGESMTGARAAYTGALSGNKFSDSNLVSASYGR